MQHIPVAVVETPEFLAATRKLLNDKERELLIDFLAYHPDAGDLMVGTGGVRKLRWALPGRGKSGGARVIYFFHSAAHPLFAITAYAKSVRDDVTDARRNAFKRVTKELLENYRKVRR